MKKTNIKNEQNFYKEDFKVWIKVAEKFPKMSLEIFNKKWERKILLIKKLI